jgi:general secretion pathway protein A
MYKTLLEYYGLIEQPFGVTPDPRFLYLGRKHREALASLLYGTEADRGFLALIARPGMGKTSLLVEYLKQYENQARTCYLFHASDQLHGLLFQILSDLGLEAENKDVSQMREALNQVLIDETQAGRRVLLVIDEAQNLPDDTLEAIRLLSNFETPTKKLIQIVLAGQPQLAARLASPALIQLRQRISIVNRLDPFTKAEACSYIDHRLRIGGYTGAPMFTDFAQEKIVQHSQGIPRNINNLCFNAMSLAYAMNARRVDVTIIEEVVADLEMKAFAPPSDRAMPDAGCQAQFSSNSRLSRDQFLAIASAGGVIRHKRGIVGARTR